MFRPLFLECAIEKVSKLDHIVVLSFNQYCHKMSSLKQGSDNINNFFVIAMCFSAAILSKFNVMLSINVTKHH